MHGVALSLPVGKSRNTCAQSASWRCVRCTMIDYFDVAGAVALVGGLAALALALVDAARRRRLR